MQPSPSAETVGPLAPSLRRFTPKSLRRRTGVDPAPEALDILRWPTAIAGHAAGGESFVDRLGVRADVVKRREIERERHRLDVAVAKQLADVLLVCDSISHVIPPICRGVCGQRPLPGGSRGG